MQSFAKDSDKTHRYDVGFINENSYSKRMKTSDNVSHSMFGVSKMENTPPRGRLDLSFTKCNFPGDYLPYANAAKKRSAASSSSDHYKQPQRQSKLGYDNFAFNNSMEDFTSTGIYKSNHSPEFAIRSQEMRPSANEPKIRDQSMQLVHNNGSHCATPFASSGYNSLERGRRGLVSTNLLNFYHDPFHRGTHGAFTLPPLPCSSSTSSSSCLTTQHLNTHHRNVTSRRLLKSCGCCLLGLLATLVLVSLSILVGFSLYLAIVTNFLSKTAFVYSVSGNFKVISGDTFSMRLLNQSSPEYVKKSFRYESILQHVLDNSLLADSLLHTEIYSFRKGSLIVFFRFFTSKSKLDALLDIQPKAMLSLRAIESIYIDDNVILEKLRNIVRSAFRAQKLYISQTHTDIVIDFESVKIGHIDQLLEQQYHKRTNFPKQQMSVASLHTTTEYRDIADDGHKSTNTVIDDEKSGLLHSNQNRLKAAHLAPPGEGSYREQWSSLPSITITSTTSIPSTKSTTTTIATTNIDVSSHSQVTQSATSTTSTTEVPLTKSQVDGTFNVATVEPTTTTTSKKSTVHSTFHNNNNSTKVYPLRSDKLLLDSTTLTTQASISSSTVSSTSQSIGFKKFNIKLVNETGTEQNSSVHLSQTTISNINSVVKHHSTTTEASIENKINSSIMPVTLVNEIFTTVEANNVNLTKHNIEPVTTTTTEWPIESREEFISTVSSTEIIVANKTFVPDEVMTKLNENIWDLPKLLEQNFSTTTTIKSTTEKSSPVTHTRQSAFGQSNTSISTSSPSTLHSIDGFAISDTAMSAIKFPTEQTELSTAHSYVSVDSTSTTEVPLSTIITTTAGTTTTTTQLDERILVASDESFDLYSLHGHKNDNNHKLTLLHKTEFTNNNKKSIKRPNSNNNNEPENEFLSTYNSNNSQDQEFLLFSSRVDGATNFGKRISKKLPANEANKRKPSVGLNSVHLKQHLHKHHSPKVDKNKLTASSLEHFNDVNGLEFDKNVSPPPPAPLPPQKNKPLVSINITNIVVRCEDGHFQCATSAQCIASTKMCDRVFDCDDNSDEVQCRCVDYLKREENHRHKICDGIIDCEDQSDEHECVNCGSNMFVCSGHQSQCIEMSKVCNGENDCQNGDDEHNCIALAQSHDLTHIGEDYNSQGILFIRHHGRWGPLCFENYDLEINNVFPNSSVLQIDEMGQAVCKASYYRQLTSIDLIQMESTSTLSEHGFFSIQANISNSLQPSHSVWSSLFESSQCIEKKVARIGCARLECGIRPVSSKLRRRIIGGQSSSFGSWPWQVALYREGEFQCGAVIIDSQWLLTAAHCFYSAPNAHWTARAGVLRRGSLLRSYHEKIRRIEHIIIHPQYVDKGFVNDIALLKLDRPLQYSKYIRTICLPSEEDSVNKWHNQLCTTVGWGKLYEHGRIFPDSLQEVKLPIISSEECQKRTLFLPLYKITENMFCAGFERGGRDACLGDSGGPMMCQKANGKWLLLGITSNGDGCGRAGRPGVYTKVYNYLDWIHNVTSKLWPSVAEPKCAAHRCPLGKCLKKEQICDRVIDCEDGSDELKC